MTSSQNVICQLQLFLVQAVFERRGSAANMIAHSIIQYTNIPHTVIPGNFQIISFYLGNSTIN